MALCAVTPAPIGAADRGTGRADPLAARSSDGRAAASLQRNGADPAGGWSYTITWRRPRESKSVTFASIIEHPLELRLTASGDRATIVGWASGTGVFAFDVVDVVAGKLLAEVPCYQPAVSPSGRYVAFVQWFPPHLTSLARRSAVYRIADAARMRHDAARDLIRYDAGTAVYPTSPVTVARGSADVAQIHMMAGTFRWAGESRVSFDDLYRNRASRVHVRIAKSGTYSVAAGAR